MIFSLKAPTNTTMPAVSIEPTNGMICLQCTFSCTRMHATGYQHQIAFKYLLMVI